MKERLYLFKGVLSIWEQLEEAGKGAFQVSLKCYMVDLHLLRPHFQAQEDPTDAPRWSCHLPSHILRGFPRQYQRFHSDQKLQGGCPEGTHLPYLPGLVLRIQGQNTPL